MLSKNKLFKKQNIKLVGKMAEHNLQPKKFSINNI